MAGLKRKMNRTRKTMDFFSWYPLRCSAVVLHSKYVSFINTWWGVGFSQWPFQTRIVLKFQTAWVLEKTHKKKCHINFLHSIWKTCQQPFCWGISLGFDIIPNSWKLGRWALLSPPEFPCFFVGYQEYTYSGISCKGLCNNESTESIWSNHLTTYCTPSLHMLCGCACVFHNNQPTSSRRCFFLNVVLLFYLPPQLYAQKTRTCKTNSTLWGIRFTHMAILGATRWSWDNSSWWRNEAELIGWSK